MVEISHRMPGMLLQSAAPMTNADYVPDQFYCVGVFVRAASRRIDMDGAGARDIIWREKDAAAEESNFAGVGE